MSTTATAMQTAALAMADAATAAIDPIVTNTVDAPLAKVKELNVVLKAARAAIAALTPA